MFTHGKLLEYPAWLVAESKATSIALPSEVNAADFNTGVAGMAEGLVTVIVLPLEKLAW